MAGTEAAEEDPGGSILQKWPGDARVLNVQWGE